jgi:hypothetical protein
MCVCFVDFFNVFFSENFCQFEQFYLSLILVFLTKNNLMFSALRGFMTHKGNVDRPRAARLILKDYVNVSWVYLFH